MRILWILSILNGDAFNALGMRTSLFVHIYWTEKNGSTRIVVYAVHDVLTMDESNPRIYSM
jgi:hypothetical protein